MKIRLKKEMSDSEKLQIKKTNLTIKDSAIKININVLSNENLFGNNLFHMSLVSFVTFILLQM